MGSTSPMPINAKTAARAVAHTAFGCLRNEAFSAFRVASAAGSVSAWPFMEGAPKGVLASLLQRRVDFSDDGKCGRQSLPVLLAERAEDAGHHGVPPRIGRVDGGATLGGEHHADGS